MRKPILTVNFSTCRMISALSVKLKISRKPNTRLDTFLFSLAQRPPHFAHHFFTPENHTKKLSEFPARKNPTLGALDSGFPADRIPFERTSMEQQVAVSLKMASGGAGEERETKKAKIEFEFDQTELRLGLPGDVKSSVGKRGFETEVDESDNSDVVDLKLNLSTSMETDVVKEVVMKTKTAAKPPAAKAQVVGWPPVRSFRKNTLSAAQKMSSAAAEENGEKGGNGATYVKVSMDGAPYLRKVDLKMYKTYQDLCDALAKMFCSFTIGNYGSEGMKDFMNCSKLADLLNGTEYVPTYEDKDGDWMLVGDVPWGMFTESCKRMRIMKGKEAVGLAPRAMDKCKNRN